MLHLKLLGPPEASRGGKPLEFRSRREQGLLFYLAAEGGMHSREKLGELLWPESQEGRAALRNALSGLRRTLRGDDEGLEEGAYIATGRGQTVGFNLSPGVELDLRILEAASGPVPLGDTGDKRRTRFDALKAAAEAYRGEFLEGFSLDAAPDFEYWAGVERERWRRRAEAVFDRLSGLQLEAGEGEGAIVTAARGAGRARGRARALAPARGGRVRPPERPAARSRRGRRRDRDRRALGGARSSKRGRLPAPHAGPVRSRGQGRRAACLRGVPPSAEGKPRHRTRAGDGGPGRPHPG